MRRVIVIGAGVGGLAAAALLARSGLEVTVLEAHVYPGGCAGTFYHRGFRFDAGATLAGGFCAGGPMDILARAVGIDSWPARVANPAMVVHLPGGSVVTRWTDERRWDEHRAAFGALSESFWRWQEYTADAVWKLALWSPPWPPQTPKETAMLAAMGLGWVRESIQSGRIGAGRHLLQLAADALRPVASHLRDASEPMRLFVDAQLLIAAQTTSRHANALYGAAALDLPRRGIVHLSGGMGAIAETLADATRRNGGQVHYRQEANRRGPQSCLHRARVERRRGRITRPAGRRAADLAGHTGQFSAFYPPCLGLGRRFSPDQPISNLGTLPGTKFVDGGRQYLSRPIYRCCCHGRAAGGADNRGRTKIEETLVTTAIWWIRRDLRLTDNQALSAALARADRVVPVFILDPALLASPYLSPTRLAFLLGGLRQLQTDLQVRGSRLIVRQGSPGDELAALRAECDADSIFAEEDFSP